MSNKNNNNAYDESLMKKTHKKRHKTTHWQIGLFITVNINNNTGRDNLQGYKVEKKKKEVEK